MAPHREPRTLFGAIEREGPDDRDRVRRNRFREKVAVGLAVVLVDKEVQDSTVVPNRECARWLPREEVLGNPVRPGIVADSALRFAQRTRRHIQNCDVGVAGSE